MKNTYTILLMSSNQDSVRQFSIKRWFALFLGLFLCLVFSLIITLAVSGMKHGVYYKTELQGEVADRAHLEKTIEQYKKEKQAIEGELEDVRTMRRQVEAWAGINQGQGILGQGGGGFNAEKVSDNELTTSIVETQSASTPVPTDFADNPLINQIIQVKSEITPIYEHLKSRVEELAEKPSILPITMPTDGETLSYWFSSGFGRRPHPLTGKPQFHNGLDIAAPQETPVIATADGVINQIAKDRFLGNLVQIEHKSTQMKTLYGHLKNHADGLRVGKQVKRYEIIGYVGNSGRSTGTHLHYGVYANGKWQNPRNHIILDDPPN